MKRKIASVVAVSLLGLQVFAGVASAVPGKGRGHQPGGTTGCAYASGVLQASTTGTVSLTFTEPSGVLTVTCTDGGSPVSTAWSLVKAVQIVADGAVTVELQSGATPVSFSGKTLEIDTSAKLTFGSNGASAMTRPLSVSVSDDALSVNGSTGVLYFAASIEFFGNNGTDTFDASKLDGVPVTADGKGGSDVLKGGNDNDTLTGGAGDSKVDTLVGGDGDDTLNSTTFLVLGSTYGDAVFPGDGNNEINGGAGLVSYAGAAHAVEIDLTGTTGTGAVAPSVEHADGAYDDFDPYNMASSPKTYVLKWAGSDEADTFLGWSTNDKFSGNGGADVIVGAGGDDTLTGDDGADRIRGARGNDTIWGGAGNDTLSGGAGDDTIRGYGGDDVLYGRSGADSLMGDGGADEAWGGNGGDLCGAEVTDHCEYSR